MKIQVPKEVGDELRVEAENAYELNYLHTLVSKIHFAFNPTYVYYVDGKRIEGKEVK